MGNLAPTNIYRDDGYISKDVIFSLEKYYKITLPAIYVDFIISHNGARLNADVFDYFDYNINAENSASIAFINAENIQHRVENIKSDREYDFDIKYKFEDGLIPFGDNGGGDLICFDYRKNQITDNPPIVIWNHDMGLKHRVVFIANNFEEFINMLHEPKD